MGLLFGWKIPDDCFPSVSTEASTCRNVSTMGLMLLVGPSELWRSWISSCTLFSSSLVELQQLWLLNYVIVYLSARAKWVSVFHVGTIARTKKTIAKIPSILEKFQQTSPRGTLTEINHALKFNQVRLYKSQLRLSQLPGYILVAMVRRVKVLPTFWKLCY